MLRYVIDNLQNMTNARMRPVLFIFKLSRFNSSTWPSSAQLRCVITTLLMWAVVICFSHRSWLKSGTRPDKRYTVTPSIFCIKSSRNCFIWIYCFNNLVYWLSLTLWRQYLLLQLTESFRGFICYPDNTFYCPGDE